MTRHQRRFLALLGLILIGLSLALLLYAAWPLARAVEQVPLPAGLFPEPDAWLLPGELA